MRKTTSLYALGVLLLITGVSWSPILAENVTTNTVTITSVREDCRLSTQTLSLSDTELREFNQILSSVIEEVQKAPDYVTAITILKEHFGGCNLRCRLQTLVTSIMETMVRPHEIYRFSPVKQHLMILSSGFTNRLYSLQGSHVNIHRLLTFWFYSGDSNIFTMSRTTIVNPYPFNVKTLTSRQIGFMRGFTGLYITQYSTTSHKQYTSIMGFAKGIAGYDLSR